MGRIPKSLVKVLTKYVRQSIDDFDDIEYDIMGYGSNEVLFFKDKYGLTQDEIADMFGVTQPSVSIWLKDKSKTPEYAKRLVVCMSDLIDLVSGIKELQVNKKEDKN